MTLLPDVRDELVAAAQRHAVHDVARAAPKRRFSRTFLLAAGLSLTLAGTAGAVLVATGVVGSKPSVPYPRIAGEEDAGMVRTHSPVVLGVAQMPTVGRLEVVAYRQRGYKGRGSLLCVDIVLPQGNKSGGCNPGIPGRAFGITGMGSTRDSNAPKIASGAASTAVDRVTLRYQLNGRAGSSPAILIRVRPKLAAQLDTRPFAYFLAEVPRAARSLVAVARNASGDIAWTARYPT